MTCVPVWIITIIIIIPDYHVAALNVLCFYLILNGRTFEVLKELNTTQGAKHNITSHNRVS